MSKELPELNKQHENIVAAASGDAPQRAKCSHRATATGAQINQVTSSFLSEHTQVKTEGEAMGIWWQAVLLAGTLPQADTPAVAN